MIETPRLVSCPKYDRALGDFAHTDPAWPNDTSRWEPLFSPDCAALSGKTCADCEDLKRDHGHLNKVAWWTAKFAEAMFAPGRDDAKAAREWGYLTGLWHDLGKFCRWDKII